MKKVMPQEIEVWYLLPALRREVAKSLIEKHNLSQKKVATILGITEAAISQYLSSKRGVEIKFSPEEKKLIEKASNNIIKDPEQVMNHLYKLSREFRGSDFLCKLHRKHDAHIGKDCRLCMEN